MKKYYLFTGLLSLIVAVSLLSGCSLLSPLYTRDKGDTYYCQYLDGHWGQWYEVVAFNPQHTGRPNDFGIGFIDSRLYYAKVKVNGFSTSDLKKRGQFYDYTGTIEYWIIDAKIENRNNYPLQSRTFVERFGYPAINKSITRPATISICKGQRRGRIVYNIFFDNVGIGFDIPWD